MPTLVPEVFFHHEETRKERERSSERNLLVVGDANLTIMLRQVSRESINKQPITITHLSVNTSQSEYAYKVPPIRRQGQILTLVQIYWRGKISQLSRATRGFLTSSLLLSPQRYVADFSKKTSGTQGRQCSNTGKGMSNHSQAYSPSAFTKGFQRETWTPSVGTSATAKWTIGKDNIKLLLPLP